jgi:hypothetical protein
VRAHTSTGLYWSIRGHVACSEHAKQILDPEWVSERWAPLPLSSQGFHGRTYQCETCSPSKTAIKHAEITQRSGASASLNAPIG